jgi:hypothetical protein
VIEFAIDPTFHDTLDVAEIGDHIPAIQPICSDFHFNDSVVTMRMFTDAVVIEQPMPVAELDALGDEIHHTRW